MRDELMEQNRQSDAGAHAETKTDTGTCRQRTARGVLSLVGSLGAAAAVAVSVGLLASSAAADEVHAAAASDDAPAQAIVADAEPQPASKDEVVYVKADSEGDVSGIYVVNEFQTEGEQRIADPGTYEEVHNLSTTENIANVDGTVVMTTLAGAPTYYEGYLDAGSPLPWDVSVEYRLNGTPTSPDDLYGADGDLEIVLSLKPNAEGDMAGFAESYVLQAQGTFPDSAFSLQSAEGATIAKAGSSTTLTYLVLPGENGTFRITGKAHGFECSGWQVTGMQLSLALDLAEADTSELEDAAHELQDATAHIADGSSSLADGLGELAAGIASGAAGASALESGAAKLADGSWQLTGGMQTIADRSGDLTSGVEAAASGLAQVDAGSEGLVSGWRQLSGGIAQLEEAVSAQAAQVGAARSAYQEAYANVMAKLPRDSAGEGASATVSALTQEDVDALAAAAQALGAAGAFAGLQESASGLAVGATQLDAGLSSYVAGVGQVSQGLQAAADGAGALHDGLVAASASTRDLAAGASELKAGSASLANGLRQIESGSDAARNGAQALATGSKTLASSVRGMDQEIIDGLQEAIDEKLGRGYRVHSYVAPDNDRVNSVQFVYVVDGVEEPADDEVEADADPADDENIIDRFLALFR